MSLTLRSILTPGVALWLSFAVLRTASLGCISGLSRCAAWYIYVRQFGTYRCQAVFAVFLFVGVFSFGFAAADDLRKERRDQRVARSAEARGMAYNGLGNR